MLSELVEKDITVFAIENFTKKQEWDFNFTLKVKVKVNII